MALSSENMICLQLMSKELRDDYLLCRIREKGQTYGKEMRNANNIFKIYGSGETRFRSGTV